MSSETKAITSKSMIKKTFVGIGALTFATIAKFGLRFVSQLFLARLLFPEHFGTYAIVTLFLELFAKFNNTGVDKYIIQYKGSEGRFIQSVFTFAVTNSLIVFILLQILARPLLSLTGFLDAEIYLRVLSFILLGSPIRSISIAYVEKDLDYKLGSITSIVAAAVQILVGVSLAYMGYGVWALVLGNLLSVIVEIITILIITRNVKYMAISFDSKIFKDILNYTYPLLISTILVYLYWNIDDYMVGKILGEVQLGFYYFAFKMPHSFQDISTILSRVTMPLLSKLDDMKKKLVLYDVVVKTTAYIMFLVLLNTVVFGREIIVYIFSEKWLPALFSFQVLMAVVVLRNITTYWGILHQSQGITKYFLIPTPFNLLGISIIGYFLVSSYGINGMSLAVLITMYLSIIVFVPKYTRIVLPSFSYTKTLAKPLISLSLIGVLAFIIKGTFPINSLIHLITHLTLVSVVYIGFIYFFDTRNKKLLADLYTSLTNKP